MPPTNTMSSSRKTRRSRVSTEPRTRRSSTCTSSPRSADGERKVHMSAPENKQLLQHIFSELSAGNSKPFVDSLADDVRWTIAGTTKWSKTFQGKQAVMMDLIAPLFAQFA